MRIRGLIIFLAAMGWGAFGDGMPEGEEAEETPSVVVNPTLKTSVRSNEKSRSPVKSGGSSRAKSHGKTAVVNPGRTPAAPASAAEIKTPPPISAHLSFDEAKNLLVAGQKYRIRYEDEESLGKVAKGSDGPIFVTFSNGDVEKYRAAIQTIVEYRNQVRARCSTASNRNFTGALDRYLTGLSALNRKALPLVADISENNNQLMLVVNRTLLTDAPILTSRYLQFKKQRFKESMGRFLTADEQLVTSMKIIADLMKVELSDEDWNRSYGVREAALENMSLWPRDAIFEATQRLTDARENVCVVAFNKSEKNSDSAETVNVIGE